jgi:hypothetical protein
MRLTYCITAALMTSGLALSGCVSTPEQNTGYSPEEIQQRNEALLVREAELAKREAELQQGQSVLRAAPAPAQLSDLLPPNAKSGECYARVWVEPTYRDRTERVLVKEPSSRIEVAPAQYETVTERVLVSEASSRIEVVPATYDTATERRQVSAGSRNWLVSLVPGASPADRTVLKRASDHGVNLDSADAGMCYHERFVPARFADRTQRVLVKEAYDVVEAEDAEYRWSEKRVLVSEAAKRLEVVPATYETVTERVVDVPAHQIWKKGTGPIQRIDEATGEIMCLVEVPATFKSVTRRVLVSPESTRQVDVPAQYETVRVKEQVTDATTSSRTVPAVYDNVSVREQVSAAELVWEEMNQGNEDTSTRTGSQICLVDDAPRYETVTRTVVKTPASSRKITIPAEYKDVQVQRLVRKAQERSIAIPGEYDTVSLREVDRDGFMEWRSILCETNMDVATIRNLQQSLSDRGYDPGPIDGVVGGKTTAAVKAFQRDKELPTDEYLNMDTIRALGITL